MKFADFEYIGFTHGNAYYFPANFGSTVLGLSARNTNVYKIYYLYKLHKATLFVFYNTFQPNFAVLLILKSSF